MKIKTTKNKFFVPQKSMIFAVFKYLNSREENEFK